MNKYERNIDYDKIYEESIILIGPLNAGKSTITKELEKRFEMPSIHFDNMADIYMPMFGFEKKEAVEKIKGSNRQMVRLTNENGHEWYISSETNISVVGELIKEMVGQQGWVFTQKDGSGLFFERQGERLIVTTQMWTGDYVLIQIPAHFHN